MYARVPAELKRPLEKEVRRIRLLSALRLYLPAVILFTGIAYLGIAWKGHVFIYLLSPFLSENFSETQVLKYFFVSLVGISAVGTFFLLRYLVTKKLFEDFLYCRRCDAFDFDEAGFCPVCQRALHEKESFFFLEFEDERKTLQSFGLSETKKEPRPETEPLSPNRSGSS